MKLKKNLFWGILLLLAGSYLIVSQLGYAPAIGTFTVIGTVVCVAVIIGSIPQLSFGGILFPLAFLAILYDDMLGITAITPWTVLIAALLGTIGLNLLFGRFRKIVYKKDNCENHHYHNIEDMDTDDVESVDGENVMVRTQFGSVIRYITSDNFVYGSVHVKFGAAKIYLDNAHAAGGNATLELDNSFGGIDIYIPKNWRVVNQVDCSLGAVEEKGNPSDETVATLTLKGHVNFAGVTIRYV